jgi:hypothetical protein
MVDVSSQNKSVSVNVSTSGNSANIKATPDMAQYYSEKSREWAISNRIVDNTDYSSKYYAEKSKESEAKTENYERSVIEKYNSFVEVSNQAETELQTLKDDSISQINTVTSSGISDIANKASEAVTNLNTNIENATSEINNVKNNAVTQLSKEAQEQLKNIESTGFYMRDDKLYFINSNGEEEEFKSGGGSGFNLFDTKIFDHILEGEEAKGWALQGTYVSGALYPDFYNKCLERYTEPTNTRSYLSSNVIKQEGVIDNNGVLGDFAVNKYATIPTAFNPSNNPWEMMIKVKTPTSFGSYTPFISTADINQLGLQLNSGVLNLYLSSDGVTWDISTASENNSLVCTTNTLYYFKISFTGTQYKLDYKTQTSEWVNLNTIDNTKPIYSTSNLLRFAVNKTNAIALNDGEIDLNESYIKINDSYFWMGTHTTIRNSNGHQFYNIANKEAIDEFYNTYGIAEFYGIDEENERVFLPRNDWFDVIGTKSDTISAYGNGKTLGLTDGTYTGGIQSMAFANGVSRTGEIQIIANNYGKDVGSEGENLSSGTAFNSYKTLGVTTNPIKSGIVASNPVKPNTNKYLYYCVGNTVVNDAEIDAGALVAQMELKANMTLDNVSNVGKSLATSWSMPSSKYIDLTLGATGTIYTAPANGYFTVGKRVSAVSQQLALYHPNTLMASGQMGHVVNQMLRVWLPVAKGDGIICSYDAGGALEVFRFIYAEGEV